MGADRLHLLTARERDCLRLVARDRDTGEIATMLGLSSHTVESHIKRARAKLGGLSRFAAARALAEVENAPQSAATPPRAIPEPAQIDTVTPSHPPLAVDRVGVTLREVHPAFAYVDPPNPGGPALSGERLYDLSPSARLRRIGGDAARIVGFFATLILIVFAVQKIVQAAVR